MSSYSIEVLQQRARQLTETIDKMGASIDWDKKKIETDEIDLQTMKEFLAEVQDGLAVLENVDVGNS